MQPAAVHEAVDRAARLVLEDHVESCLRGAATNGTADDEWARLKGSAGQLHPLTTTEGTR